MTQLDSNDKSNAQELGVILPLTHSNNASQIKRFSSLDGRLDQSFLSERLKGAKSYKRIAGYFRSSIFELVGEEIEDIDEVRVVCNAELDQYDIAISKAARERGLKGVWNEASPEVEALLHLESSSGINAEDSQLRPLLPHDGVQKSDALNIGRDETDPGGDHRSGVLISRSGRLADFAGVDPLPEGEAVLGSRAAVVAVGGGVGKVD